MIKISELKEGNVLCNENYQAVVLQILGKVVVIEDQYDDTHVCSEKELNGNDFKLMTPPTPEKKYYMGFEVREYPERPIVEVNDYKASMKKLRRLVEVTNTYVLCKDENGESLCRWAHIYRIPETIIVEPTSSGTREGDGC